MITDCPNCRRQFRINAWQLSAAKGLVQCGFCGEQFNALERLHDKPLAVAELLKPHIDTSDDEVADEPQFEIPDNSPRAFESKSINLILSSSRAAHTGDGPDNAVAREDFSATGVEEQELANELLGQLQQKRSIWGTMIWTFGVLGMLLIVIAQLSWFNRDWILSRYPEYRPLAREFCQKYQCEITRERDLNALVLLNRDVRDHPRYAQALLVNATIENQSEIVQPYPAIRLSLYDTEGNINGYRIFNPTDYLDNSINVQAGMPSRVPIHIVLELSGATESAVSFEFNFI